MPLSILNNFSWFCEFTLLYAAAQASIAAFLGLVVIVYFKTRKHLQPVSTRIPPHERSVNQFSRACCNCLNALVVTSVLMKDTHSAFDQGLASLLRDIQEYRKSLSELHSKVYALSVVAQPTKAQPSTTTLEQTAQRADDGGQSQADKDAATAIANWKIAVYKLNIDRTQAKSDWTAFVRQHEDTKSHTSSFFNDVVRHGLPFIRAIGRATQLNHDLLSLQIRFDDQAIYQEALLGLAEAYDLLIRELRDDKIKIMCYIEDAPSRKNGQADTTTELLFHAIDGLNNNGVLIDMMKDTDQDEDEYNAGNDLECYVKDCTVHEKEPGHEKPPDVTGSTVNDSNAAPSTIK